MFHCHTVGVGPANDNQNNAPNPAEIERRALVARVAQALEAEERKEREEQKKLAKEDKKRKREKEKKKLRKAKEAEQEEKKKEDRRKRRRIEEEEKEEEEEREAEERRTKRKAERRERREAESQMGVSDGPSFSNDRLTLHKLISFVGFVVNHRTLIKPVRSRSTTANGSSPASFFLICFSLHFHFHFAGPSSQPSQPILAEPMEPRQPRAGDFVGMAI